MIVDAVVIRVNSKQMICGDGNAIQSAWGKRHQNSQIRLGTISRICWVYQTGACWGLPK